MTTTPTPILGIRVAATLLGRANRGLILPQNLIFTNESGAGAITMVFNPAAIVGGTWIETNPVSGVEYNEGITSITGGDPAGRAVLPTSAGIVTLDGSKLFSLNGFNMRLAIDGTPDVLVFIGNARSGTVTLDIVMNWLRAG